MDGLVAMALPVRGSDGSFIAAIAFHGPSQRLDIQRATQEYLPLMRDGAARLATLLVGGVCMPPHQPAMR